MQIGKRAWGNLLDGPMRLCDRNRGGGGKTRELKLGQQESNWVYVPEWRGESGKARQRWGGGAKGGPGGDAMLRAGEAGEMDASGGRFTYQLDGL